MPDEEPKGQRILEKLNEVIAPDLDAGKADEVLTALTRCLCAMLAVTGLKFKAWIAMTRPVLQEIRRQHAETLDADAKPDDAE